MTQHFLEDCHGPSPRSNPLRAEIQFFRLPAVCAMFGISKTKIYDDIRRRKFPPPIKLGRTSVWSVQALSIYADNIEQ